MLMLTSVNYIDRTSLSVAMPLIGKELGLDPAMQGLILSSFFWTYAFMQVPSGVLVDVYKPRIVIALSTVGWGFFQTVAAVSTNWVMLLLTRLGLGATEAPIYPAGGKLNAIWMTPNERARGATLLSGGAPLGAALGAIVIAGLITGLDSWRLAFIVAGIGTMACGLLAWWYVRNSPREHPMVSEPEARRIEEAHAAEDAQHVHIRGRIFPLPLGLVHVPGLDVLQQRVQRTADLVAQLPVQGTRFQHRDTRWRNLHLRTGLKERRQDTLHPGREKPEGPLLPPPCFKAPTRHSIEPPAPRHDGRGATREGGEANPAPGEDTHALQTRTLSVALSHALAADVS